MKRITLLLLCLLVARPVSALTVVVDYTYDSTGFFTSNLTAKAALERAASDISGAITSSLGALTPSSLSFTGTNGSTTATADWYLSFSNPTTGSTVQLDTFTAAAGEFRVFVGARSLTSSTLGQGGPVGAGLSLGSSGSESQWAGAVANMQTSSNNVMTRAGGPVIGSLTGSASLGASNPSYTLNYGALAGNLWFDNDANNDGSADADLSSYWHFDSTTSVGAGLNDFYSVALHEMLHSLGFGSGDSWDDEHSGTTWLGSEGIAANGGTGVNLVDGGSLAHVASGVFSTTLNGDSQEAVMDPSLTTGTRKYLTLLDLAMLEDIGYSVTAVPEPATFTLLAALSALGLATVRRPRRT